MQTPKRCTALAAAACFAAAQMYADVYPPQPGWNLFSKQHDIQLGREASAQVDKQMRVVQNPQLDAYITRIGNILRKSPHAGDWPFEFHVVYDKNINAFSLPGGPVYINTATIEACDNEAQLAGVLAHEMSHVVLRHATHQATKANLLALPAAILGASGSLLGVLASAGIQLTQLHFSREDEAQADYNGVLIMADAGYNPLELANFFEKLESGQGGGRAAQFLSDHPNPGDRVQAVQKEIRELPHKQYTDSITGQFAAMKTLTARIAAPPAGAATAQGAAALGSANMRPSDRFVTYKAPWFSLEYPDNWQVYGSQDSNMVTIAPRDGVVSSGNSSAVGYGIEASFYFPTGDTIDVRRDSQALIDQLRHSNTGLKIETEAHTVDAGSDKGLSTVLAGPSPFRGETEVDTVITVPRPQGLFYLVFIAPRSEQRTLEPTFNRVLRSLRFSQ